MAAHGRECGMRSSRQWPAARTRRGEEVAWGVGGVLFRDEALAKGSELGGHVLQPVVHAIWREVFRVCLMCAGAGVGDFLDAGHVALAADTLARGAAVLARVAEEPATAPGEAEAP